MQDALVVSYQGPRDATHYEIIKFLGGRANAAYLRLEGKRHEMTNPDGEWGHGVYCAGTTGMLEYIWAQDCYGDGFTLAGTDPRNGEKLYGPPEDMILHQLTSNKARRNGLSIIAGRSILVDNCTFANTYGAPRGPEAGIDLEPDPHLPWWVEDVRIKDCLIDNNASFGIISDKQRVRRLTIENTSIFSSLEGWALLLDMLPDSGPHLVTNCTIYGPIARCNNITFDNCTFIFQRGVYAQVLESDTPIHNSNATILPNCTMDIRNA